MLTNPLAMLSFVAPWMAVGAVAAVGLPLLAHLLSRTKYREVTFPAARLVQKAVAATSRIEHPRHRLLMLLRWMILLLLVIAFMRPQWLPEAKARDHADGVALVVLIDASASMQRTIDGATLYERAVREAQTLMSGLDPSRDVAAVIRVDRQGQSLLPEPTAQLSLLSDRLRETQPGYTSADWSRALATAQRQIKIAQRPGTVITISDQQAEAPGLEDDTDTSPISSLRHVRIDGPTENTAVRLVDLHPYPPIAGQPITATVDVNHFGNQPRTTSLTASLGDTTTERTLTLSPGSSQRIELRLPTPNASSATLRVTLDSQDAIQSDNTTGIPLSLQSNARVMIVHDASPASFALAKRVATLVNPGEVPGTALPTVDLNSASEAIAKLKVADASSLRTVILLNAANMPEALSPALEAYCQSGGGVVQFVADPTDRNQTTTAANIDFSLPALRVFEGPARGGLAALEWPGVDNAPLNEQAKPLLVDTEGRTIIAALNRSRGRVVAINAVLSTGPGGLLAEPAFVVLFNELCRYASPGPALPDPIRPGDPMPSTLQDAEQKRFPTNANLSTAIYSAPGQYAGVDPRGSMVDERWVELDPAESDTTSGPAWVSPEGGGASATDPSTPSSADLAHTIRPNPTELWPYLVLSVLLLVASESLLLARFAGARRPAGQGGAA